MNKNSASSHNGSAIVEFVLSTSLISFLLMGLIFLARLTQDQKSGFKLAQLGTELRTTLALSESEINDHLLHYADAMGNSRQNWRWQHGRFTGIPAARFYRLFHTTVYKTMESPFSFSLEIQDRVVGHEY